METFLEILREILKGILREVSAYFFRKSILENKKTTLRRHKQMNCTPIVRRTTNNWRCSFYMAKFNLEEKIEAV
ncbi:hypothetical protein, partial [Bacillus sp. UNC438CL73TsuS30]|uniref:hypothetical protein n=1 Tax=Bacillus sp. UNC438CL73TsuS30 TaxID=1340434 RepID=UPI000551A036